MIEFIKGCKIPNSENLKEEYKISGNWIKANVNASKILKIIVFTNVLPPTINYTYHNFTLSCSLLQGISP